MSSTNTAALIKPHKAKVIPFPAKFKRYVIEIPIEACSEESARAFAHAITGGMHLAEDSITVREAE